MNFSTFDSLRSLFERHKWFDNFASATIFKRLIKLLNQLTDDQTELIFELLNRFKWIASREYDNRLNEILNEVYSESLKNIDRLFVFPIRNPDDQESIKRRGIKSADSVVYQLRGIWPLRDDYAAINIIELTEYELITEDNLKLTERDKFILFDDYIGTGETLKSTLSEVYKNKTITPDNLLVASILIQEESIKFLDQIGVKYFYSEKVRKGITNYYHTSNLVQKVKLMEEVECILKEPNFYNFGYRRSEALVSMVRTPDNTFPVFWIEHKIGTNYYPAPFPRNQIQK